MISNVAKLISWWNTGFDLMQALVGTSTVYASDADLV
jgi:hypothetical protein